VNDEMPEGSQGRAKVVKAEVITVVTIDKYKSCQNYNAKIVDSNAVLVLC